MGSVRNGGVLVALRWDVGGCDGSGGDALACMHVQEVDINAKEGRRVERESWESSA